MNHTNNNTKTKKVSVVIPAFNEEFLIEKTLKSLMDQDTDFVFETILVDNNSTDNTVLVARQFENKLNLKIIKEEKKGRGSARYTGFKNTTGSIILSTDADTVVPKNWIELAVKEFEDNPNIIAITGSCRLQDGSKKNKYFFKHLFPHAMKLFNHMFGFYWFNGFNFAVRKSDYEKSGGFDPSLNVQEDTDLSIKFNKLGEVKFVPSLYVSVSGRRFENGLFRGLMPYVKSFTKYYWFKSKDVFLDDPR